MVVSVACRILCTPRAGAARSSDCLCPACQLDWEAATGPLSGGPHARHEGHVIGSTLRRTLSTSAVLSALALTACSGSDDDEPTFEERGYPDAPAQEIPESRASDAEPVASSPIAELAEDQWIDDTAGETGVPARAVAAYAGASLRLQQTHPECEIGWNTLAGIGQVESLHGHHGDSSLDEDGVVSPPIIGVPLDGSEDVMEIPDTDDGALDGDPVWDRAVGPMQFIPETWTLYAEDGNLDGETDPQQIDDAALTAAVYLCSVGEDITEDEQWNAAISAYNQSLPYVQDVADHAASYAE